MVRLMQDQIESDGRVERAAKGAMSGKDRFLLCDRPVWWLLRSATLYSYSTTNPCQVAPQTLRKRQNC